MLRSWQTWLLLVGLAALSIPAQATGQRVALVIANSRYQHINALANPLADGQAVAERLKKAGFKLLHPVRPNSDVQADLSLDEMLKADDALQQAASGAAMVVLYYAGHGLQVDGVPYLLPVELPAIQRETLQNPAGRNLLKRRMMELDELVAGLDQNTEVAIAIFDACREIPQLEASARAVFGNSPFRGLVRPHSGGKHRLLAYSASSGELAKDGEGAHSPYTQAWLDEFDRDSGKDILAFFNDVAHQVTDAKGQNPEVVSQGIPSATYYLRSTMKAAAVAPPIHPKPVTKPSLPPRCEYCPGMMDIPAGEFFMGSDSGNEDERPRHKVFVKAFKLARHEVTRGQFALFVRDSNYASDKWHETSLEQDDNHPVVNISIEDIHAYIQWLNGKTGQKFRLPSEVEWEYAARAGSSDINYWGKDSKLECIYANIRHYNEKPGILDKLFNDIPPCIDKYDYTSPVGSFKANAFGLFDMLGNASEMTCTPKTPHYYRSGEEICARIDLLQACYVFRGGSWESHSASFTARGCTKIGTEDTIGFRLALD